VLLQEVEELLSDNGISGVGFGALPATPDAAVALYEYPGQSPVYVKNRAQPVYERPRFQVITRDARYIDARNKAEEVFRLLTGYSGRLGGVDYQRITAVQSPFFLDRDDRNRPRFVCNFEAQKELSPTA
jgi:hypothetical protein